MKTETILQSHEIETSATIDLLLDIEDAMDPQTDQPALHLTYEINNGRLGSTIVVECSSSNSGLHFQHPPASSHLVGAEETLIIYSMMVSQKHRLRITNPGPSTATITVTRTYRSA